MNIDLSKIFYRMRKRILLDFSNNILTNRINTLDNHKKCIYVMDNNLYFDRISLCGEFLNYVEKTKVDFATRN